MWAAESLNIRFETIGQVLVARVSGFLTVQSSEVMRHRVRAQMMAAAASAVVLDLREATHVMTEDDWRRLAAAASSVNQVDTPAATVVRTDELAQANRHAQRMLARGFSRFAFADYADALGWAQRRGAYWTQWEAHALQSRQSLER